MSSLLMLPVFLGCGGGDLEVQRGDVSGTVTFQGKPVIEGDVNFLSRETGRSASAPLDENGRFTIDGGVEVGHHVVMITPPIVEVPPGGAEPVTPPKEHPQIPQKYRSDTTSDLVADVKAGGNDFTFDLK